MSDMFRGKLKFLLVALTTGAIAVACSDDSTGPGGNNEPPDENVVELQGLTFNPSEITVPVGTTIEWQTDGAFQHTITSNNDEWPEEQVPADPSHTFSHEFDEAGTYDYVCELHENMTGTIIVDE